jgi:hypothetical membrane protein
MLYVNKRSILCVCRLRNNFAQIHEIKRTGIEPLSAHALRMSYASCIFSVLAGVFLTMLGVFDTKAAPTLHLISAVLFFVCAAVNMTLVTVRFRFFIINNNLYFVVYFDFND